jgi:hypothetical protein
MMSSDTFILVKGMKLMRVKFSVIIYSKIFHFPSNLVFNQCLPMLEALEGISFVLQKKNLIHA